MVREHAIIDLEEGQVTIPFEAAANAVWNAMEASDDREYLAMLALHEGVIQGDTPEEVMTCFIEETGLGPRRAADV